MPTLTPTIPTISGPARSGNMLAMVQADYRPTLMRDASGFAQSAYSKGNKPGPACVDGVVDKVYTTPDVTIDRTGALAVVRFGGVMKFDYGLYEWIMRDCWTVQIAAALDECASDPSIAAVLLEINSPGGTVSGFADIAQAADRLNASGKQIAVLAHERLCSAAYWLACRVAKSTGVIVATQTATVGSIGICIMAFDTSRAYEDAGVKVIPITTGTMKAAGADGVPISDSVVAMYQTLADETYTKFSADVAAARGISVDDVTALQGAALSADQGMAAKLIDGIVDAATFIENFEIAYGNEPKKSAAPAGKVPNVQSLLRDSVVGVQNADDEDESDMTGSDDDSVDIDPDDESDDSVDIDPDDEKGKAMSKDAPSTAPATPAAPTAATLAELKAIFPDAADQVIASMEAGHTIQQAQAARIAQLEARASASAATAAQLAGLPPASKTTAVGTGAGTPAGNPMVGIAGAPSHPRDGDDHAFIQAVTAHAQKNSLSARDATIQVAQMRPELHANYIQSLKAGDPVKLANRA